MKEYKNIEKQLDKLSEKLAKMAFSQTTQKESAILYDVSNLIDIARRKLIQSN